MKSIITFLVAVAAIITAAAAQSQDNDFEPQSGNSVAFYEAANNLRPPRRIGDELKNYIRFSSCHKEDPDMLGVYEAQQIAASRGFAHFTAKVARDGMLPVLERMDSDCKKAQIAP